MSSVFSFYSMHFLLAFVLLSLAFAQDADKDGIITLTEKNFHDVIHANKNVFVFFHSAVGMDSTDEG